MFKRKPSGYCKICECASPPTIGGICHQCAVIKVETLAITLRSIEWKSLPRIGRLCPACYAQESEGHKAGCLFVSALKGL